MSHIDTSFEILKTDIENNVIKVKYINLSGPVELGEVPYDPEDQSNPNRDIIFNLQIPLDENGNIVSNQEILDFVASQYPQDEFDRINNRIVLASNTSVVDSLNNLVGSRYNMQTEIVSPETSNDLGVQYEII